MNLFILQEQELTGGTCDIGDLLIRVAFWVRCVLRFVGFGGGGEGWRVFGCFGLGWRATEWLTFQEMVG